MLGSWRARVTKLGNEFLHTEQGNQTSAFLVLLFFCCSPLILALLYCESNIHRTYPQVKSVLCDEVQLSDAVICAYGFLKVWPLDIKINIRNQGLLVAQ